VLYGGLGRHQVERLAVLRRAAERIWDRRVAGRDLGVEFEALFNDVLAQFDVVPDAFSMHRVQDELIGQMAELLQADYDTLSLELDDGESRERAVTGEPRPEEPADSTASASPAAALEAKTRLDAPLVDASRAAQPPRPTTRESVASSTPKAQRSEPAQSDSSSMQPTTARLQAIQQLVADELRDEPPESEVDERQATSSDAGEGAVASNTWFIDPSLDTPRTLRQNIARCANEVASEFGVADLVRQVDDGITFADLALDAAPAVAASARALLRLLRALIDDSIRLPDPDSIRLAEELAPLLVGREASFGRLSDQAMAKLFQMLRLARRLHDLMTACAVGDVDDQP
jgi:hypothetical protein